MAEKIDVNALEEAIRMTTAAVDSGLFAEVKIAPRILEAAMRDLARQRDLAPVAAGMQVSRPEHPSISIGKYVLRRSHLDHYIHIDREGEGGDFDERKLVIVLNKFFQKEF